MSDQENEKSEVGYKRPPKHTQFKPGQSGNPKGRKKGVKNFITIVGEELESKVVATDESGNKIVMTKRQAFVKRLVHDGVKGKPKSAALLIPLMAQYEKQVAKQRASEELRDIDYSDPEKAHEAWLRAQRDAHEDNDD